MNLQHLETYLMRHMPSAAIAEALAAARLDFEEALAPREQSPELAEAEAWLRMMPPKCKTRQVLVAELERLRQVEATVAEAEQRGRRQAFEEAARQVRSMERLASNSLTMDNGHHHKSTAFAAAATWLEAQRDACTPSDGGTNDGEG